MNRTTEWLKVVLLGAIVALLVVHYVGKEPRVGDDIRRYSAELHDKSGNYAFMITDHQTGTVKLMPLQSETVYTASFESGISY